MSSKKKPSATLILPTLETTEQNFKYIEDDLLRANIAITLRYIIFLIIELNNKKITGSICYSIYKDIIIHTAAIVESSIHYCLKTVFDKGLIKKEDVMDFLWKEEKCISLYKISEFEEVCGVFKHKKYNCFGDQTPFNELNIIAKKSKIFDQVIFDCAEEIRKARNKIHLAALKKVDDYYQPKDVNNIFDGTVKILNTIKLHLASIKLEEKS